ncbi:DUF6894 family protein [Bradyrhizobium erythrophlei]|jgi:hypothetical protein|nr:hypothetical protein [Bradyrhizobium erythrophlei]
MLSGETPERLYSIEELVELRRNTLRYARSVPAGETSIGAWLYPCAYCSEVKNGCRLTPGKAWCHSKGTNAATSNWCVRGNSMQKFFFDMKDGVPLRDSVGLEFKTNADAIAHCKVLAQHFRDESLRDDQDLEISVVNALGREIHRQFVHRE